LLLLAGLDDKLSASCCAHHLLLLLLWAGVEYPLLDNLPLGVHNILDNLALLLLLLLLLVDLSLLGWMDDLLYDLAARLLYDLALSHHNLLARLDTYRPLMLLYRRLLLLLLLLLLHPCPGLKPAGLLSGGRLLGR
jgi:hypothetical protein